MEDVPQKITFRDKLTLSSQILAQTLILSCSVSLSVGFIVYITVSNIDFEHSTKQCKSP